MNDDIPLGTGQQLPLDERPAEVVDASSAPASGFDDRKAPGAFRTIGEVAQALGIRQHVLRYWEEHFPMLRPVKRSGNRRYYRPEDVQLVATIDRLVHHQGYTLRGARLALEQAGQTSTPRQDAARNKTSAPSARTLPSLLELVDDNARLVGELMAIRATLASVLEA